MERVRSAVANEQCVHVGRARRPDDRAEVPRPLHALGHEQERGSRRLEARERRAPALDDGEQPVWSWTAGDGQERGTFDLDDPRATALGFRDEEGLAVP